MSADLIGNAAARIELMGTPAALWRYRSADGVSVELAAPVFEVDGDRTPTFWRRPAEVDRQRLPNGVTEHVVEGEVDGRPGLSLRLVLRVGSVSPVVRFRYELWSTTERRLTRATGRDALRYTGVGLPQALGTEVRLSDYDHLVHSYVPTEVGLDERAFDDAVAVMGPLLTWPVGSGDVGSGDIGLGDIESGDIGSGDIESGHAVLAYEHGSQHPDRYAEFACSRAADGAAAVELVAVKGTYLAAQDLRDGYGTLWMHLAVVAGPRRALEHAYRDFVLRDLAVHPASRTPAVFYNTWNNQERVRHWTGRPFLADMNAERMLAEIDVAHRIGIEVFVIDTGWYDRTGDWRVDPQRFPDGLDPIHARLASYGMRLGLWFGPTSAALSSGMRARNLDNRMSWRGVRPPARSIWETEESEELCLVSSYAEDFADELIRAARDFGVTYFKWDAIGQYGCDAPHHRHGDETHTPRERADSYAFQQPLAMARIVERLTAAVPEAIVDFDVTESHRCVGLSFLSVGKYFLINNGPYLPSFDVPTDRDVSWSNPNLFFYPGPARGWVCRTPLAYDTWIPSVLFLTHYLPDDPASNQDVTVGSLVLGQNGMWGDLLTISDAGVDRMARLLRAYVDVRDDVTAATLVRTGIPGGVVEICEKVSSATGRGVIVVFANGDPPGSGSEERLRIRHVGAVPVDRTVVTTAGLEVGWDARGRPVLETSFDGPGAAMAFFGAREPAAEDRS